MLPSLSETAQIALSLSEAVAGSRTASPQQRVMIRPLAAATATKWGAAFSVRRQLSTAPTLKKRYLSTAEDRLLDHLSMVAAKSHEAGNLEQSQQLYEHLINARRMRNGDRHPLTVRHYLTSWSFAASTFTLAAAWSVLTAPYRFALQVCAIGSLSVVAKELGDYRAAEELAREAMATTTSMLGAMHPDSLLQQLNLSAVLTRCDKLDEAEAMARSAVDGYRSMFGEGHADLAHAESNLGQVLLARAKQ